VYPIKQAAKMGNIVLLLLPYEIASEFYYLEIHEELEAGNVLCFASGYNITLNGADRNAA